MRPAVDKAWLHPDRVASVAERSLTLTEADTLASAIALLVDPTRLRMLHALAWADELCIFDLGLLLTSTRRPSVASFVWSESETS